MPNRRQFLFASSALGLPLASVLPLPALGRPSLRLGLLQVREPFVDPRDPQGSRRRAFSALQVLLQRSLAEREPLDWVATSAFPLSGPLAYESIEDCSLTADSDELLWLRQFADQHALRISLTAWYRADYRDAVPALLDIGPDGSIVQRPMRAEYRAGSNHGLALDTGLRPGRDTALAERCRRLRLYGAGVAACHGPNPPPGVPVAHCSTTRFIDPSGRVRAQLPPGEEGCLAVSL